MDYSSCYNPQTDSIDNDPTFGLKFTSESFARFGLKERWAYYDFHQSHWLGPAAAGTRDFCESADLLLNLSGVNPLRPWSEDIPVRVFVDTDPAFTQIRNLTNSDASELAAKHTAFFTFAENIGQKDCLVPDDGFAWQPTRQPVVLDAWAVMPGNEQAKWTTVMQWDSYRAVEHEGQSFGMKSESFKRYLDLPASAGHIFELALGSQSVPRKLLRSKGWQVVNPLEEIRDVWEYQSYLQRSKGEWSIAKQGYVVSNSGWFSERSANYLASGWPVVTEGSGFSRWLPPGRGVFSFNSPDEALSAIEEVNNNYELHSRAARQMAVEFFSSSQVLSSLIERAYQSKAASI